LLRYAPLQHRERRAIDRTIPRQRPKAPRVIDAQAKAPLTDAGAVNATRWALYRFWPTLEGAAEGRRRRQRHTLGLVQVLADTGLPIEASSGGRTKYNRTRLGIPKTHALGAARVREVGTLVGWRVPALAIKAMGRGRATRFGAEVPKGARKVCMSVE
jgi:hypothetical protein